MKIQKKSGFQEYYSSSFFNMKEDLAPAVMHMHETEAS